MLLVTEPSEHIYDSIAGTTKNLITDSEVINIKIAAIHALSVATFYGGASLDETQDVMDFFLEIVSSDGHFIDAPDNPEIVTAALDEWGFLATQMEEMEETSEEPMDAFVEQLDSSDVSVQVAAGENIALLYEKSWTELDDDEERPRTNSDADSDEEEEESAKGMAKRYTVYRQEHLLIKSLESITKVSSKRISKKDRKSLHSNFADILSTVEHPTRGPRYNAAISNETNKVYGSRMKVSIGKQYEVVIDKWWKLIRLKALKRVLQGGFLVHYEDNSVVSESLPGVSFDD